MVATLPVTIVPPDIDETQPLTSPSIIPVEPSDYYASCARYEKLAELRLRNSDTIVLGGYGCFIKVVNGALSVEYQRAHENHKLLKMNRGTHKIRQIIICAHGGYLTLDAIEWLIQQQITAYIMDWKGEIVQTLSPRQNRNARLTHLQWCASESEQGIEIARELIRLKTLQQIEVLKQLPLHLQSRRLIAEDFEYGLAKLLTLRSIESIRILEAHLAMSYWSALVGVPIRWKISDLKMIPADWQYITERTSDISSNHNGSNATNPFHATLNFAYALLGAQVLQSINVAGLESTVGFLHSYQDGKQSLAFDLMEPFRSVVDSMVLKFFSETTFKKGDFIQWFSGECRLNEELRRYILASCRVKNEDVDRITRWLRDLLLSSNKPDTM